MKTFVPALPLAINSASINSFKNALYKFLDFGGIVSSGTNTSLFNGFTILVVIWLTSSHTWTCIKTVGSLLAGGVKIELYTPEEGITILLFISS